MAAFLMASQPARASAFLFAMLPQIGFAAPGAVESVEVRLTNAGPDPAMTAGFTLDLTTADPAAIVDDAPSSTLETYGLSGTLGLGPDAATSFTQDVGVRDPAFAGPFRLAAGDAMGLERVTYSIPPESALAGIPRIGVASPGIGTSLSDNAGDNVPVIPEEMKNTAVADVSGPKTLLPAGLFLLGLGAVRRRHMRMGRRRRRTPGMRKSTLPEARKPGQANPIEHYYAV
jgi:hypothetical protein